jgi:PAS domain S-box-containing protein
MKAEHNKPTGKRRFFYGVAGMLILGVVVPTTVITVHHLLFSGRPLVNPSLHAFMESLGVLAAFLLAVLLLFIRKEDRDLAPHVWIACGLLAMGILDGLHATQTSLAPSVELSSASALFGGFLFVLVWLPERASWSRVADALPVVTVGVAGFFGLALVADPNLLPSMIGIDGYTPTTKIITAIGGALFFVAAIRFVQRYREGGGVDDFLFASLCLLFGMAGCLFPFSLVWNADWWSWHLIRLVAFLHIIYYMFFVFRQTLTELQELTDTLERRVEERTAELAAEVAERKQTEAALRESETRYRRLVGSVTGYTYSVRVEDGRPSATCHSSGSEAVTGYTPEEYAADPGLWLHMVHEEDRQAVIDQAALVLSGSDVPPLEHRLYHKDGRVRWVMNRTVPHLDGEGRLVAYDGLVSDITERKLAEEEIRTYNEELLTINRVVTACSSLLDLRELLGRVLEESMGIVGLEEGSICILNNDGSLNFIAHRGLAAMVSIDPGGMSGDCFYRTCSDDFLPIILRDREAVLRVAGQSWPHGGDVRFHAAFPLVTGKRTCVGVLCLFSQTETKPSERSLRLVQTITAHVALVLENVRLYEETLSHAATLEGKVAQRTLELEEANRKLREIDRTKSLFIASMSHELRTPLNSVIGFSSILLNEWVGPLNEEQKENLAIVLKAGEHLLALINDVIDVSKIEAGQIAINRETFDLNDVIAEAVSTLGKEIRDKGLALRVDNVHRTMRTDRQRLLQCLLNLLNNAAKYTEKGSISVRAGDVPGEESTLPDSGRDSCRDYVEIAVEDTGIGIGREDMPRIFEPFTRLNSQLLSRVAGTGLGLYLTRKLVTEVLGGEVRFASESGRGSVFALVIPVDGGE